MNASELIELLRKHPKACATLGITEEHMAFPWTPDTRDTALRWITVGKCVEWCDAHGLEVHREATTERGWYWFDAVMNCPNDVYPSRLHATLAAMEAHDRLAP